MIKLKPNTSRSIQMLATAIISVAVTYLVFSVKNIDNQASYTDDKRVIKCVLPLAKELNQNVFYVAEDIISAKKEIFNSKKGLYFEGKMYIKTKDYNGKEYVVPFSKIDCDSVGYEVTQEFKSQS